MTLEQINKAPIEKYSDEEWKPLIDFFWDRYNKRYFDQIKYLQNSNNKNIRNNCGFLIATIDCILIETLEQYYSGKDESEGKGRITNHSLVSFKGLPLLEMLLKMVKMRVNSPDS